MIVLQKNLLTLAVASALIAGPMALAGSVQADDLPPAPPGPYMAEGMKELSAGQSAAGTSIEMKVPEATAVAEAPNQEAETEEVAKAEEAPEQKTEEVPAEPLKADAEPAIAPEAPKAGEVVTAGVTPAPAEESTEAQLAEAKPAPAVTPQPQMGMGVMAQMGMQQGMPPQMGMGMQRGMPPQGMQPGMMPGYPMRQMPMMYGYPQYYQPRPQVQYIYVVPMMMPRRGNMTPQQMQQMQRSMNMHGGRPPMQGMMRNRHSVGGGHAHDGHQGQKHHQNDGHDHATNEAPQKEDNGSLGW